MTTARQSIIAYLLLLSLLLPPVISAQTDEQAAAPVESSDVKEPAAESISSEQPVTTSGTTDNETIPMQADVPARLDGNQSIDTLCRKIDDKLGSVSYDECITLDLNLTGAASATNTPILFKEYAPLANKIPQGRVLLLGGVHGDEYSSVSIVFKWLHTLDQFHSGLFHWHIVPLVNPDGLLMEKSTRTNANSVDINRNFPTPDWNETALKYWTDKTDSNPRHYPGSNAASEPETAWLVDEIEKFDPDVIVSVHAPHGVVDYDGPQDGPYKLGRLYLNLLGTFPGSLGNYAGIQKDIPVVTIELPYAGIMPSPAEVSDIWRDLVRWLTRNIPAQETVAQETDPS